jgi:hypothetical protein
MCSNIPASPAYGVYISQLIRYARASSNYSDFLKRHLHLRNSLLDQGYKKIRLIRSPRHPVLPGISINQELTQIRSKIAYKARQLYRERKLKGTWVLEEKVVMVDKNDSKHFIRNSEEFLDLLTRLGIPPSSDKKVPKTNLQNSEAQDMESGLKYH